MKLIPKYLEKKIPRPEETAHLSIDESRVYCKFFNPTGVGTWFVSAYDPEERIAFGYANLGHDEFAELGYFSLDELESLRLPFGLKIERDLYFSECSLRKVVDCKGNL